MKTTFIFVILAASLLAACQKEVDHETVYQPYSGSTTTTHGTIDSGGGNGFCSNDQAGGQKCVPLESFRIKDPTQLATISPDLAKVISGVEAVNPQLAADFLHIMKGRGWYSAPVTLNQISATQLGVSFQDGTNQLAIQSRQEIWFNKSLMDPESADSSTEEARSQLVVHELVMGLRILAEVTTEDQCVATATKYLLPPKPDQDKYDGEKSKCHDLYGAQALLPLADFSLSPQDYGDIRDLASNLFQSRDRLDGKELEGWIAADHIKIW